LCLWLDALSDGWDQLALLDILGSVQQEDRKRGYDISYVYILAFHFSESQKIVTGNPAQSQIDPRFGTATRDRFPPQPVQNRANHEYGTMGT
jgi:hypothetical protein